MDAAISLSRERDGAVAAAKAVGQAVEEVGATNGGGPPSAVVVFASTVYGHPEVIARAARAAARGASVIGCAAPAVLGAGRALEGAPGVVALALRGGVHPVRVPPTGPASTIDGARLIALFGDGYSRHPEPLVAGLGSATIIGGLATASESVGPAFRWLDGELVTEGAVGVALAAEPLVGVAQGCRPIGPTHTVTEADGNVIVSLDGQRAFDAFATHARPLLDDLPKAAQTVFVAVAASDDPVEDAFVVRGCLRFDPERGLLGLSEPIARGTRIRFALRDAWAAREGLRAMIDDVHVRLAGRAPRFGFYFGSLARGRALFGVEDHDLAFIHSALGDFPLAGFLGGGELGPVRGRCRLQLFSGVLAVFP